MSTLPGDTERERLTRSIARLRAEPARAPDVSALAQQTGLSVKRLDAHCREHYHLSASTLILRARVSAAAKTLAQGEHLARAGDLAGFAEVDSYQRGFRQYYGLRPQEYRALARDTATRGGATELSMTLPEGFATEPVRHLMDRDPSAASERVSVDPHGNLVIERGFQDPADCVPCVLQLTVRAREAHLQMQRRDGEPCRAAHRLLAHRIARRLLGFESHLPSLRARARQPACAWFLPLLQRHPGLRVPLMGSEYEALIWAVLGQQVNLRFAAQLRAELIRLAQPQIRDDCLLPHPTPAQVARLAPSQLHQRRFSRAKANWVVGLSQAIVDGTLDLTALAAGPAASAHAALVAQKGVGDWTAQYVMLRGMGYNDCVPAADAGLMRNLQGAAALAERPDAAAVAHWLAPFAPARSVACQHLWAWRAVT